MRVRRSAFVMAIIGAALTSPVALAGDPGDVAFDLRMGGCGIKGRSAPSASFRVKVKSPAGALVLDAQVTSSAAGTWNAGCIEGILRGGERIIVRDEGVTLREWVVPRLTARVDRVTDTGSGVAPTDGDSFVSLYVYSECYPLQVKCYETTQVQLAMDPVTGVWTTSTYGDTRGGDTFRMVWGSDFDDTLVREQTVPYLEVRAGTSGVMGAGVPGKALTAKVRSPANVVRGTATATPAYPFGGWSSVFRKNGAKVKIHVGDTVTSTIASDASLLVRAIAVQVDTAAEQVSGTCYPKARFGVRVSDEDGNLKAKAYGKAGPSGTWFANGITGIDSGWTVSLGCGDSRGDVQRVVRTVP